MYVLTPNWIIAAQDDPAAIVAPAYLLAGAAVLTAILSVLTAWLGRKHEHRGRAYDTRVETYSDFLVQISTIEDIFKDIKKFYESPEVARVNAARDRLRRATEELNTLHGQLVTHADHLTEEEVRTQVNEKDRPVLDEVEAAKAERSAADKHLKRAERRVKSIQKRRAEVNKALQQTASETQILGDPATRATADQLMEQTGKGGAGRRLIPRRLPGRCPE